MIKTTNLLYLHDLYLFVKHTKYTWTRYITGSFMSTLHTDSSTTYSYDTMSHISWWQLIVGIVYVILDSVDRSNDSSLVMLDSLKYTMRCSPWIYSSCYSQGLVTQLNSCVFRTNSGGHVRYQDNSQLLCYEEFNLLKSPSLLF